MVLDSENARPTFTNLKSISSDSYVFESVQGGSVAVPGKDALVDGVKSMDQLDVKSISSSNHYSSDSPESSENEGDLRKNTGINPSVSSGIPSFSSIMGQKVLEAKPIQYNGRLSMGGAIEAKAVSYYQQPTPSNSSSVVEAKAVLSNGANYSADFNEKSGANNKKSANKKASSKSANSEWELGNRVSFLQSSADFEETQNKKILLCNVKKGLALCELGMFKNSVQFFSEAISVYSDYAPSYWCRAMALIMLNDFEGCMLDCFVAHSLEPDRPETFFIRGLANCSRRMYQNAIEDFNDAIKFDSNMFEARIGRAIAHLRRIELGEVDSKTFEYAKEAFGDLNSCMSHQEFGRDCAIKIRLRFFHLLSTFDNTPIPNGEAILTAERKRVCSIQRLQKIASMDIQSLYSELADSLVYEISRIGLRLDVISLVSGIKILEGSKGMQLMHKLKARAMNQPQAQPVASSPGSVNTARPLSPPSLQKISITVESPGVQDPDLIDFRNVPKNVSYFFLQDFGLNEAEPVPLSPKSNVSLSNAPVTPVNEKRKESIPSDEPIKKICI